MLISPPFGYKEIVPFLKTHKVRLPAQGEMPPFAQQGNVMPITHAEFQPAARDYPLIFTADDKGKTYSPVAVLGLGAGENLFYANGHWAPGAYIPAYARRYPFCMAKIAVNRVEQKKRLICVEKSFIDEGGTALFDDKGEPSARWRELEKLLGEYEADIDRMREMSDILADYGLLEPFSMQATFKVKDLPPVQLTGMHRVVEKRLEGLNAAQLKNLVRKGIFARIYLHLISLENFGRLIDRKAARKQA